MAQHFYQCPPAPLSVLWGALDLSHYLIEIGLSPLNKEFRLCLAGFNESYRVDLYLTYASSVQRGLPFYAFGQAYFALGNSYTKGYPMFIEDGYPSTTFSAEIIGELRPPSKSAASLLEEWSTYRRRRNG